MEIGWFESVLLNQPSWIEDSKIKSCSAVFIVIYPSIWERQVNTVKIEGSGWSNVIEPIVL